MVGKVSNFNKAVAEAKNTGNYDGVKKAQKDLEKSLRKREHLEKEVAKKLESRNDNKNRMEAKAQANSQKDKIFALINKEASKEARIIAYDQALKGIKRELSDRIKNINKNNISYNALKDSIRKNIVNLWIESAKQVPTSLQAKLDNYATNSHTRINSNVQNGAINERATGMLTQKNPEWLKLVNDKIVAHNVGSAHLSEYDKIGFNQKNMKDYSDSFKFSTKLNNAVKDIKFGFHQLLINVFYIGSYNPMKAEHGVKNINWIQPKERLI